eukprot:3389768-Pyramimonas_sp.AAC.1
MGAATRRAGKVTTTTTMTTTTTGVTPVGTAAMPAIAKRWAFKVFVLVSLGLEVGWLGPRMAQYCEIMAYSNRSRRRKGETSDRKGVDI